MYRMAVDSYPISSSDKREVFRHSTSLPDTIISLVCEYDQVEVSVETYKDSNNGHRVWCDDDFFGYSFFLDLRQPQGHKLHIFSLPSHHNDLLDPFCSRSLLAAGISSRSSNLIDFVDLYRKSRERPFTFQGIAVINDPLFIVFAQVIDSLRRKFEKSDKGGPEPSFCKELE